MHSMKSGEHLHGLVKLTTIMFPLWSHRGVDPVRLAGGGNASEVPTHELFLIHEIQDHLRRVYDGLCNAARKKALSKDMFGTFLCNTQKLDASLPEDKEEYSFEEFLWFLFEHRMLQAVSHQRFEDKDLTWPITNYFISSSHNTYLSGNQLSSKSSTESYKNVLRRGCRCIEIDVWNGEAVDTHSSRESMSSKMKGIASSADDTMDKIQKFLDISGGHSRHSSCEKLDAVSSQASVSSSMDSDRSSLPTKPEPQVLHGRTLTSAISFRDVCQAIKETAFETSELPIIVSLEVHADWEQQHIMVDIMQEEWKGMLVEMPQLKFDPEKEIPTLGDLQRKILVKVKRATRKSIPESAPGAVSSASANSLTVVSTIDGESASEDERGGKKKKNGHGICERLAALGVYTQSAHFDNFEQPEAKKAAHIFSISENKVMDMPLDRLKDLFSHNLDFFMRVYPAGFRVDSSNLDPSVFWRNGIQMAALNWQKVDEGMMLNEGMFDGEYGWMLKPYGYRRRSPQQPLPSIAEPAQRVTVDLVITVYAGQHIPRPPGLDSKHFHPYIKGELHVEHPEDRDFAEHLKQRTSHPRHRGDHPDWGKHGERMEFLDIPNVIPELSFIRFKIQHDESLGFDTMAAWACLRLDRVQQGYRFINLLDAKGQATPGFLLVKIDKVYR